MKHRIKMDFLLPTTVGVLVLFLAGQALATVQNDIENSLKVDVLDAFFPRSIDEIGGGYNVSFEHDWTLINPTTTNKMIVSQARHVYTTSMAAQFYPDDPLFESWARHGYQFLRDKMRDPVHGGYYYLVSRNGNPVDTDKFAYGHAFVIFALAYYYELTGDPEAKQLAAECFQFLEDHVHDDVHLGYHLWTDRQGNVISRDPFDKDQNASLHLMEAFSALYRVAPDTPNLRTRLVEMVTIFTNKIQSEHGFLQQTFTRDWRTYPGYPSGANENKQYNHFSYGHDLEVGYLLWDAMQALGWNDNTELLAKIKQMVDFSLDNYGFNPGGGVPAVGYYDESTGQVSVHDASETWWVQSEALNCFLFMSRLYPSDPHNYYGKFLEQWLYIQGHFLDPTYRGYVSSTDGWFKDKGHNWFVAYHTSRTHMNAVNWLRDDQVPPSTPTNAVVADVTSTSVTLTWGAATDNVAVSGYRIYRNGVSYPIGYSNKPSATIEELSPNTQYTFHITARDFAGNISGPSNTVSITTPSMM